MLSPGDPGPSDPRKGVSRGYFLSTFSVESEKYQLPFVISLAEVCMF